MKKQKKFLLIGLFCTLGIAFSAVGAAATGETKESLAETVIGDLEARYIMPNDDTAYTKQAVALQDAGTQAHRFTIMVANLEETFDTSSVTSFIIETEQYTPGYFTPIVYDKYGNYYQAMGAATGAVNTQSGNFEFKKATSLAGLETAAIDSSIKQWGSVGGSVGKYFYEFSVENFMWRYITSNNYFLEESTPEDRTGNGFENYREGNSLMAVGLMNYTGNANSFKYSMDGFYACTDQGVFSLLKTDKLTLSAVEITSTAADTTPNAVFQATISGKAVGATSNVTLSLVNKEVPAFDGMQARFMQKSQYKVAGFSLDPTGQNAAFSGKLENVESLIFQLGTSKTNKVVVRPLIVDEYGRHMENLGAGTPPHTEGFYYRAGKSPENLTYYRTNGTVYTTIGAWGGYVFSGSNRYLEVPITEFAFRGRYNNYGDNTTEIDQISYYVNGDSINVQALGIIVTSSTTEGTVWIGDISYRNTSGEIIKIASADEFTIRENITTEAGCAFDFGTSLGSSSCVVEATGYLEFSAVQGELGRNYASPDSSAITLEVNFPQIKSVECDVDYFSATAPISDFSGYEAFSYDVYNLDSNDLTLDFFVQIRKTDGSWGADRKCNAGKALFLPLHGSPFVGTASVVPAGFYGTVIIPLSSAGFYNLTNDALKIVTSNVFCKIEAGVRLDSIVSGARLLKTFPVTYIDESAGTAFGLNGEYTLPKVTFVNGGTELSSSFYKGASIAAPDAPEAETGKVFIGWEAGGKLYPANYMLTSTETDVTFNATYIAFAMKDGASVRVTEPSGIRFRAEVVKADYDTLISLVGEANATFGMRVVRGGTAYLDIEANNKAETVIDGTEYAFYNGVIVNIDKANYQTAYCGTGYVDIVYADNTEARIYAVAADNTRTISDVAKTAYEKDESLTEEQKALLKKYFESEQEGE